MMNNLPAMMGLNVQPRLTPYQQQQRRERLQHEAAVRKERRRMAMVNEAREKARQRMERAAAVHREAVAKGPLQPKMHRRRSVG